MTIFDYRIISLQTRTKPLFFTQNTFWHFSDDYGKFQIFEIFRFWGIPGSEKYFFANFFRAESFVGRIS